MKRPNDGNMSVTSVKNMETAESRSNIYNLLSIIYGTEVTENLLKQIRETNMFSTLSDMGVVFGDDFLHKPDKELLEDLAVEYARLFLGPDKHISPHESVHHKRDDGDWGNLWGKSTVEIKKFIETAGLEYKPEYSGLPDHISVELEFMHEVTGREARAWEEKDSEGAIYCIKMEKKFIEEHLVKWIPVFCDKIISEAELSFYREMAKLTGQFIKFESEEIDKYLVESERRETCSDSA
ncbi:MAG TPA: hypothetical protein ENG83_05480 [Nitrospirae bacterium]|nr:chaperone protein TorD [bacterium BMS3Abin06]HDH11636.1 hypothetical protein [Nitrospirota bacterium]HDL19775.1 hypothetical protein [Nitrospirota bacterium]HDZ02056.1 hypothetical protein [Nitrospirota bacterium]